MKWNTLVSEVLDLQAHLRDVASPVPDHGNKVNIAKK